MPCHASALKQLPSIISIFCFLSVIFKKNIFEGGSHDAAEVNEFLKESILMKDLCHPNVMELIGICIDGDSPYIILPYLEGVIT